MEGFEPKQTNEVTLIYDTYQCFYFYKLPQHPAATGTLTITQAE